MRRLLFLLWLPVFTIGCRNPFFPNLGDPIGIWSDQITIGGLLNNFRNAYMFKDSLRYAECLACPDYQFNYFDPSVDEFLWMSRDTDLRTTGRLFRHYETISLEWSGLDEAQLDISVVDSLVQVTVFFDLRLDEQYLNGYARFDVIRSLPADEADCRSSFYTDVPVFRIVHWWDE